MASTSRTTTPTQARPDGAPGNGSGAVTAVQDFTALRPPPPRPASQAVKTGRASGFAPLAGVVGWMTAWGVAAVAVSCLLVAGVDLGLGLGLVEGAYGADGLTPGLYLVAVQVGAFLIGGYAAARHARGRGLLHAALAWSLAMIATGADTFMADSRNDESVLEPLFIPFWIDNGMGPGLETALALGAFGIAGLAGALIGGALGTAANKRTT